MKLSIVQVGKTDSRYLNEGLSLYYSRIRKMITLEIITVNTSRDSANKPWAVRKNEEADKIAEQFKKGDIIVLLDEAGEQMDSRSFASFIQKMMNTGPRRIVFIIGGSFGINDELKKSANRIIALSRMTFSHQMVRLLFAEQLYRAFTILKGIPYHHD